MPAILDVDEEFRVGDAWFASVSPSGDWAAVFEDDGQTAYFYAMKWDARGDGSFGAVLDALHIYNAENVTDRSKPSRVQIAWTENGSAAMLLINRYPHAVFDRAGKRATCRTGFPPPSDSAPFKRAENWDAPLVDLFR